MRDSKKFTLNSGSTIKQGEQLYHKRSKEYSDACALCFINPLDLCEINAVDGENLKLTTDVSSVVLKAVESGDQPSGQIFIPDGPHANFIIPSETHGTGAPDFKGIDVRIEKTEDPVLFSWDLIEHLGGMRCDLKRDSSWDEVDEDSTTISNVPCPLCGCICDDIEVVVNNKRIISARNCCSLGCDKFMSDDRLTTPIIRTENGWKKIGFDEAVNYFAELFAKAERPLLFGWSGTHGSAQAKGIEIAELIGGVIDNCSSECHGPSIMAIQEVGHPGCTLGQVKNRADVVIYWGCNPVESHPRHMSRYTTYPDGKFVSNGHNSRKLIVADVRKTDTAKIADIFLELKPNSDYCVFAALRAISLGKADVLPDDICGVPKEKLIKIIDVCKNAKYGAVFTGIGLTQSRGKYKNVRAAIEFVDEMNRHTKFSLSPMRGHWNVYGANQVSSYMTGYPYAVDFSRGIAYYNPGETSAIDILRRQECDACLIIGTDPGAHFPAGCVKYLADIPTVVMDPYFAMSTGVASLHIPVAAAGIDAEGLGYRMDAVPIHVKKLFESGLPDDTEILDRVLNRIKEIKNESKSSTIATGSAKISET